MIGPRLKTAFVGEDGGHFGSGWLWLTVEPGGGLKPICTHDGVTPLLVCDLWEPAHYLDHQDDRQAFLAAWFDALPNWSLAASQLAAAQGRYEPWRHPAPITTDQLDPGPGGLGCCAPDRL